MIQMENGEVILTKEEAEARNMLHPMNVSRKEWVENEKRELWKAIAIATAGASNTVRKEHCERWADHVVAEYGKRFLKSDSTAQPTQGETV